MKTWPALALCALTVASCSESGRFQLRNDTGAPIAAYLRWRTAGELGKEVVRHDLADGERRVFQLGQIPLDDRVKIVRGRCAYVFPLPGDKLYALGERGGFPVDLVLRADLALDLEPRRDGRPGQERGFPIRALSRSCDA